MPDEAQTNPSPPAGAILSDQQVARLKKTVVIMTAVLVVGVITLIGRIIYLASNRSDAPQSAAMLTSSALKPEATVALPTGHDVKSIAMSGNRLLIHHVGPAGDGVMIVDLATGQVQSRVTVRRTP